MSTTLERLIARVGELSDFSKIELRLEYPYSSADSRSAVLSATKGMSRGEIIKVILSDEFDDEDFHNEGCYAERR